MASILDLDSSVQYLKGVGPQKYEYFKKKSIFTLIDLLENYPRAYETSKLVADLKDLESFKKMIFKAKFLSYKSFFRRKSRQKIYELILELNSKKITCRYFRQPYQGFFEQFHPYDEVKVIGKIVLVGKKIELHHPDIYPFKQDDDLESEIKPLYSESEKLKSSYIHKTVLKALEELKVLKDHLSDELKETYQLNDLYESYCQIHQPKIQDESLLNEFKHPSQKRLIFEEFFRFRLMMLLSKKDLKEKKSKPVLKKVSRLEEFEKSFNFELTDGQKRIFSEIKKDLKKTSPMNRLVQGDVGSGKTVLSFLASFYVIENGFQVAFMVPTEVLAEQHYKNALTVFGKFSHKIALLTSQVKGKKRKEIYADLESGKIQFCIGTHSLIQEKLKFKNLNLVIIDEQHRFGVDQRKKLLQKGFCPHFLLMTATPIPRTLALTAYSDLDLSSLSEMPKGRKKIITKQVPFKKREDLISFIRKQVKDKKRQAYIVFPLVEESESLDLKNASDEFENLQKKMPECSLALLHGKLKSDEKNKIMKDFYENKVHILVCTTVIEVGLDVPNASIIWVENAERFGLSQLHQLRGRVGRGASQSYCLLSSSFKSSKEALMRMSLMEEISDGFKLSEADLELRGPGEFLGLKQSGLGDFKLAHLIRDKQILKLAIEISLKESLKKDFSFEKYPFLKRKQIVF